MTIPRLAHFRNMALPALTKPGDQRGRLVFLHLLLLMAIAGTAVSQVDAASRAVRVGIYQNKPKIFVDEKGQPAGIYVDLLNQIAAEEHWTLTYVPCQWADCLAALEAGQIDLMPDVAYTADRAQKYDFHHTPVLTSWSQVYASAHIKVDSFNDLAGKKVAILKDSVHQTVFQQYMSGFGFTFTLVPTASLEEAFQLAGNGSADAAIANNFFGDYYGPAYGLVKTPIVFNPATLFYATAKGHNADLLDAIERHLTAWLQASNTPYYTAVNRWTQQPATPVYRVPPYVYWAIGIIGGALVVAVGMIWLLRTQVQARTKHLEQANQALRESELRYQLISTVASDYMFSTHLEADGRLRLKWVAGAFEAITGYTFEEYVARGGWRAALHPDDLAQDDRDLEKLRANQPVITEVRTLAKSGETVWVRVYAHPVLDAARQALTGIYGAVQDITERKRAEEVLAASEKRLSLIFDTVSDVIYLLSVEGEAAFRFTAVNPAFLAVTGLSPEQVVGKRVEEVLPETAHALVIGNYRQAIRENKTAKWEEKSVYPTGTLYGAVTITPARNTAGVCTHLIGSVHDITEIRRAEEAIRNLNQELEQRVADRTAELSARAAEIERLNAELATRAQKLEAVNRELEAFSYSVSHDLKAPLRGIDGYSRLLQADYADKLDEEGRFFVHTIRAATEQMGQLIDALLAYSRLERRSVSSGLINLPQFVADVLASYAEEFQAHQVALTVASPAVTVHADTDGLAMAVRNLVDNALKFTRGTASPVIEIGGRLTEQTCILWVRDNGIGFDMKYYDRIFEIFQRLQRAEDYPGTGVGLALVRKAMQRMGGRVWAESQLGQGATFYLEVPR